MHLKNINWIVTKSQYCHCRECRVLKTKAPKISFWWQNISQQKLYSLLDGGKWYEGKKKEVWCRKSKGSMVFHVYLGKACEQGDIWTETLRMTELGPWAYLGQCILARQQLIWRSWGRCLFKMFQSRKGSQSGEQHEQQGEWGERVSEDVEEQGSLLPADETSSHKGSFIHVFYLLHFVKFNINKDIWEIIDGKSKSNF